MRQSRSAVLAVAVALVIRAGDLVAGDRGRADFAAVPGTLARTWVAIIVPGGRPLVGDALEHGRVPGLAVVGSPCGSTSS